jgi:hypothetical protein
MEMTERPKPDPTAELHRNLEQRLPQMACSGISPTLFAEAVA